MHQDVCRVDRLQLKQILANSQYINQAGLMQLVSKSRLRRSLVYATQLGVDTFKFKTETAELATTDYIITAFNGGNMIELFVIGKYRIDLYFLFTNVPLSVTSMIIKAEMSTKRPRGNRSSFITEQLSCQWVRFNPQGDNFSIAAVTNAIFTAEKSLILCRTPPV